MKLKIAALTLVSLGLLSTNVSAALTDGTTLSFNAGSFVCPVGGVYTDCSGGGDPVVVGSWWGFDINNDGTFDTFDKVPMSPGTDGGIVIGKDQVANEMDSPWMFLGIPGNHVSTTPISVVDDTSMTKILDFSGWGISWNANIIPIGDLAEIEHAQLTCSSFDCADGDTFVLDFYSTVPMGEPVGFGGISYAMHLEGVIVSAVPVPAAFWLLVSGMSLLFVSTRRSRCKN